MADNFERGRVSYSVMRGNIMNNVKKQFNNLKKGAKRVFVGMMVLCLICTATGIGSIFAYADEYDGSGLENNTTENSIPTCEHSYGDWTDAGDVHTRTCSLCGDVQSEGHSMNWVAGEGDTEISVCSICGHQGETRSSASQPAADPESTTPDTTIPAPSVNPEDCTHNYTQWYPKDALVHTRACSICQDIQEEEHNIVDGKCTVCGYEQITDESGETTPTDHVHSYSYYADESKHYGYCYCGDYVEGEHQVTYWAKNGTDNTLSGVCEVCGELITIPNDGTITTHIHEYTYEDNHDGTHTARCSVEDCPEPVKTESHRLGDWTSDDHGHHVIACALCDYSETEDCDFGEWYWNGDEENPEHYRNCYVCGYEEREACTVDPETGICSVCQNQRPMMRMLRSSLLRTTATATKDISGSSSHVTANDDIVLKDNGDVDYARSSGTNLSTNPYKVWYKTDSAEYTLTLDTDYTVSSYSVTSPQDAGTEIQFTITGKGDYTGTVRKAIVVDDPTIKFNGGDMQNYYKFQVEISAPGYEVSISPTAGFASSFTYSTIGTTDLPVYLRVSGKSNVIKKTISGLDIRGVEFSDFFTDQIEPATDLVYTGANQSILRNYSAPTKPTGVYQITSHTDSDAFLYNGVGSKTVTYSITYVTSSGATPVTVTKDFTAVVAPKPLTDNDITATYDAAVLNNEKNISFVKANATFSNCNPTIVHKIGTTTYTLQAADYTLTPPTITEPVSVTQEGQFYYVTVTGTGKYTGTLEQKVEIEAVDILYDKSATKKDLYIKEVQLKPSDSSYTIALEDTAAKYGESVVYNTAGKNQSITVYLKHTSSGKRIKETVDGINIIYPQILYDSRATMDSYYKQYVDISANDFKITKVKESDGTITTVDNTVYRRDKIGENQKFTVYFVDSTGKDTTEIPIEVKDLNIYEEIDIPIKYNGDKYYQWFNKNVVITADGYNMKLKGSTGNYQSSYTVSTEGKNKVTLEFFNKTTKKISTYTLEINIDTGAPTGKVSVSSYNSTVFVTTDGLKKNVRDAVPVGVEIADTLSGPDYALYYIGEKFYASQAALTAAVPITSSYWLKYDGSNMPTINVNKKNYVYIALFDEAGNTTFISTGLIASDTSGSSGSITIDDYVSRTFLTSDSHVTYTNQAKKALVTATNNSFGIESIEYYVGDAFYGNPDDVLAAIREKQSGWRGYSATTPPQTTFKDKSNYFYVKITDTVGITSYLSTGAVVYDVTAPKMTSATITKAQTSNDTIIALAASDKLSGVNRFKMEYKEKNPDDKGGPDKNYLFNMGTYIEVKEEKDGTAVASYTVNDLDSAKTYMFYFVAVDRAGNISDVMSKEVKGSEATNTTPAAGGGAAAGGSGSGSKSGGLTPAPSGIAGGGGSQSKPKGGAGKSTTPTQQTNAEKIANTKINRNPYIGDATGSTKIGEKETGGWTKILSELNKADKGTMISVEMSGFSEVPDDLLTNLKKREDVNVKLQMADDVEWSIVGADITDESFRDMDLGVKLGSKNIPAQILQDVTGTNPHVEFSVNHEGDLGFTATIGIPVGVTNKGMNATLYYYDANGKELKPQSSCIVDGQGFARFPLTHCSDYTVVISPEPMLATGTSVSTVTTETLTADEILDGTKIRLTDLFGINQSGRIWLFVIALISAGLCIAILFLPSFQQDRGFDRGDLL